MREAIRALARHVAETVLDRIPQEVRQRATLLLLDIIPGSQPTAGPGCVARGSAIAPAGGRRAGGGLIRGRPAARRPRDRHEVDHVLIARELRGEPRGVRTMAMLGFGRAP